MSCLVLWDVDHTLIENAGVSKEIYASAFAILTGLKASHRAVTDGRTDPDIMAALLHAHGRPAVAWPRVREALIEAGCQQAGSLGRRGSVLPGVIDLVSSLAARTGVVQTIVSGNVRANAEVKLGAFGLLHWLDLDVGGFGSDDRDRGRLVALARARAAAKYGSEFGSPTSAVVIGDTPRDVQAARDGGARVLAVASGVHDARQLRSAGADCVMPNLVDTAAALGFVLQLSADS